MENYKNLLAQSLLFNGLTGEETKILIEDIGAVVKSYGKGQYVLEAGTTVKDMGIVIEGEATILKEDFWGNVNIVTPIEPGDIFAITYAIVEGCKTTVSVVTDKGCKVVWINGMKSYKPEGDRPQEIQKLYRVLSENLITALAQKNLVMNDKITYLSQRSIREKVMTFLGEQATVNNSNSFEITMNRQQLADYLSVDRSALSSTLSKLRDEEILLFSGKCFTLL